MRSSRRGAAWLTMLLLVGACAGRSIVPPPTGARCISRAADRPGADAGHGAHVPHRPCRRSGPARRRR